VINNLIDCNNTSRIAEEIVGVQLQIIIQSVLCREDIYEEGQPQLPLAHWLGSHTSTPAANAHFPMVLGPWPLPKAQQWPTS